LNGDKTKVAIIGGGCAGMTAAFELTATPALQARFEVTLHTIGWRLGGKGASGRNQDKGLRIEEHGLHVWFGFYDNAFDLIQRAFGELPPGPDKLFPTWRDAFEPCHNIILWEEYPPGTWTPRFFDPPMNNQVPGSGGKLSFWEMAHIALRWLRSEADGVLDEHAERVEKAGFEEPSELAQRAFQVLVDIGASDIDGMSAERVRDLLPIAHKLAETRALNPEIHAPRLSHERLLSRLVHGIRDAWENLFEQLMKDPCVRFVYMAQDFARAVISGIVPDVLLHGFAHLDELEWKDWLHDHGASNFTLQHAPWIKGYYDLTFAFKDGDTSKPNLAAGTAMKDMLRIAFNYKGAVMWKMQAGMGDVVFSQPYRVLKDRGVNVRFFQRMLRLELSPDKTAVEKIHYQPQVRLTPEVIQKPEGYDPFVAGIKNWWCWPSEPNWEQIVDGQKIRDNLKQLRTTLEDEELDNGSYDPAPAQDPDPLVRGQDFDYVILATSVESVRQLCAELYADDANLPFQRMLDNSHSVITQAFQLWCNKSLAELGWPEGLKRSHKPCFWGPEWRDGWLLDPISSAFVEPLDTYSDMTHLIQREHWKAGLVKSIAYFCGPMAESRAGSSKAAAKNSARADAIQLITDHLEVFWPGAYTNGNFDWGVLVDEDNGVAQGRFDAQYWRANRDGSERYVTSFAGTVKYRLEPDESGYDNLLLAGDWTKTEIDGGCVEAAVISGKQAAKAIIGSAVPFSANTYPFDWR
jgi:uncharacterized protein with NAD-binding domain and iron-sulfur cluster